MTEIHISFLLRLSRITTTGWLVVHTDYLTGLWKCDAGLEFRRQVGEFPPSGGHPPPLPPGPSAASLWPTHKVPTFYDKQTGEPRNAVLCGKWRAVFCREQAGNMRGGWSQVTAGGLKGWYPSQCLASLLHKPVEKHKVRTGPNSSSSVFWNSVHCFVPGYTQWTLMPLAMNRCHLSVIFVFGGLSFGSVMWWEISQHLGTQPWPEHLKDFRYCYPLLPIRGEEQDWSDSLTSSCKASPGISPDIREPDLRHCPWFQAGL